MSKFLKVMIVLLTIAAVAAPAMAEDRLSLSGSMQVRGFFVNQDDGTDDDSAAWNDQRLRVAGKIAVAEGVSVNFRFDASESAENSSDAVAWGGDQSYINDDATDNKLAYAPYSHRRADIQFDKAYLQIEKGGYTVMAGELYFAGFGIGRLLDTVGTGFIVKRGPVTLAHVKQYEQDNLLTDTGLKDASLTAAKYSFKNDSFSADFMAAYNAYASSEKDLLGLGVFAAANLGVINLKGELDFFDGDDGAGGDREGLQLYLDASTGLSETLTVGGILLYAAGSEDEQVNSMDMPIFADWKPLEYGYNTTDFAATQATFEPFANAGIVALQLYADVKVSDELGLKFAAAYGMAEDDKIMDYTGMTLNASAKYNLMANTSITTSVNYSSVDDGLADDNTDTLQVISGLYVNF